MALPSNSLLFREYIGTDGPGSGARFPSVPIHEKVQFHFIVSSAIDYDTASPPVPTNGIFRPFWNLTGLSAERVASIKQKHLNVKVILSLGGDTVDSFPVTFQEPGSVDADEWVKAAVDSLTGIINGYKFDGIDINYMHFRTDSDSGIFADCIGRLLKRLKEANGRSFITSIAPSTDEQVRRNYKALWRAHGNSIDYVNFKFYTYPPANNVDQFLQYFYDQSHEYNDGKVLASITSVGDGGLSPANGFWDACRRLKSNNQLHGIFIWSADLSLFKNDDFSYEDSAQDLLANGNNQNN